MRAPDSEMAQTMMDTTNPTPPANEGLSSRSIGGFSPSFDPNGSFEAPPALTAPPGVESLWHAVRERWVLILSLGLVASALAFGIAWMIVPGRYSAAVQIDLNANPPMRPEGDGEFRNFQRTQSALVTGDLVVEDTLKKPTVAELREVQQHSDPTRWLEKDLKVDTLLGPSILRVSLTGDNAEDLAIFLNELAETYIEKFRQKAEAQLRGRAEQLQKAYSATANTLRERREDLRRREAELGVEDSQDAQQRKSSLYQQLQSLTQQSTQYRLKKIQTQTELAETRRFLQNPATIPISAYEIDAAMKTEFIIRDYLDQIKKVNADIEQLAKVAPEGSREIVDLQARRQALITAMQADSERLRQGIEGRLRAKLELELRSTERKLETQLSSLEKEEVTLDGEIADVSEKLRNVRSSLSKAPPEIESLRDGVEQTSLVLKRLGEDLGSVKAQLSASPRVDVMQPAQAPKTKEYARKLKFAVAAALGTFGLVFFGVALFEFRLRRVYSSDDVSQGLGMPLIGTIPILSTKARRLSHRVEGNGQADPSGNLPAATLPQHFALLESIDSIRTILLHQDRSQARKVVMITSALMGEGKTSLSCHLAASMARAGKRTLLVDCDLRNPAVHRQFRVPQSPGMCEVLTANCTIEEVIQPTGLDNLAVVSAGQLSWDAIQALPQDRLEGIFEYLRNQFDLILIDTSPVMPVTDPLLIGKNADAVLFSVMRNVSRLPALHAARQKLAKLNLPILGAVMIGDNPDTYGTTPYPTR